MTPEHHSSGVARGVDIPLRASPKLAGLWPFEVGTGIFLV